MTSKAKSPPYSRVRETFLFILFIICSFLPGNVPLSLRTRLKCVICKTGPECDVCEDAPFKHVESKQNILVLNEVVVDRGCMPYLGNLDLYIEHKYITSVQGDGLIISTPTGSTAYAAAAGASMVHPNVPAIVIAPICPHSLSFRPIVVPAGVEIKLMVSPNARGDAWVSFDGRNRLQLSKGDM
jgi:NAD+ kinase